MPPFRGSKRVKTPDGRTRFISQSEDEDVANDTAEKTISVTESQLQEMLERTANAAVERALASVPKQEAPQKRVFRNEDFVAQMGTGNRQNQEQVTQLSLVTGGCSHPPGTLPAVPEFIVSRDLETHRTLISQLEVLGYVVMPVGVELRAYWRPTKKEMLDGRKIVMIPDDGRPEPAEAKPLLAELAQAELTASRIYIQRFASGRGITGDRQMDDLVADDSQRSQIQMVANQVLAAAQSGLTTGYFGVSGDGIDLGSDIGAAAVEAVSVG